MYAILYYAGLVYLVALLCYYLTLRLGMKKTKEEVNEKLRKLNL
jgi:hypothetical protein